MTNYSCSCYQFIAVFQNYTGSSLKNFSPGPILCTFSHLYSSPPTRWQWHHEPSVCSLLFSRLPVQPPACSKGEENNRKGINTRPEMVALIWEGACAWWPGTLWHHKGLNAWTVNEEWSKRSELSFVGSSLTDWRHWFTPENTTNEFCIIWDL